MREEERRRKFLSARIRSKVFQVRRRKIKSESNLPAAFAAISSGGGVGDFLAIRLDNSITEGNVINSFLR